VLQTPPDPQANRIQRQWSASRKFSHGKVVAQLTKTQSDLRNFAAVHCAHTIVLEKVRGMFKKYRVSELDGVSGWPP
jgi:hypothetical protein